MNHICKEIQESFFKCRYCMEVFDRSEDRMKHEKSCKTVKCPVCDKWLKSTNLARHLQTVHILEEQFESYYIFSFSKQISHKNKVFREIGLSIFVATFLLQKDNSAFYH